MSEQKPTIEAGRRRPTGDSAPTGRVEAPSRRRSSAGSGGGLPPASGGTGSSLPGMPGGMPRKLSLGGVLLLIVVFVVLRMFSGGSDSGVLAPESDLSQLEEPVLTVEMPVAGDTFTNLEEWSDLDAQGNVVEVVRQEGETLTFGEEMFTWQTLYAAAGRYVVGFVVEDLDGNAQTVYMPVTVR